jgi:two-component system sensor histidine kinase/response regulator
MARHPRILIVEDDPNARELFGIYLGEYGYHITEAHDGEQALILARSDPPDLVITDIMLPRMNGFEVARQVKQMYSDQFLPVIIATALRDQSSKLLGYRVGADDFLSHPIDRIELGVRVAGLLSLRARHRGLARRNVELAELQRFRDEMASTVVHDLKNPLAVILANLSWTTTELERAEPDELRLALAESQEAGRRMLRLLGNLVDVSKSEANRLQLRREPTSLATLLSSVAAQRRVLAQSRDIKLEVRVPADVEATIDVDMITRALENIIDNGLRYTPTGGKIVLGLERSGDAVEIVIGNDGPAIPEGARHTIFEKYGQTGAAGRMNLGLGLYFCRLTAEAHGGALELGATAELPTLFRLRLPLDQALAAAQQPDE